MKATKERFATLSMGAIVGIALVVSCDHAARSGAAEDMGMSATGACGGSCSLAGPVTVSSVQQPVAVTAAQPLAVSGAVSVSGSVSLAEPIKVASIASPVTIAGPTKVITAESDPDQLQSGDFGVTSPGNSMQLLGKGPFVLTDVYLDGAFESSPTAVAHIYFLKAATCPAADPSTANLFVSAAAPIHGAHIFIPAGSIACGSNTASNHAWYSGFALYTKGG